MRTLSSQRIIPFLTVFLLAVSCKKDAPVSTTLSASTIQGNWKITSSAGTEWRKDTQNGTPQISTPKADDPGTVGIVLTFTGSDVTAKLGSTSLGTFPYTLDAAGSTILIGPDGNNGLGFYTISNFVGGKSMKMDQRLPIAADFDYRSGTGECNCYLAYQKFWTLTKQ